MLNDFSYLVTGVGSLGVPIKLYSFDGEKVNEVLIGPPSFTFIEYICQPFSILAFKNTTASVLFNFFAAYDHFTGASICANALVAITRAITRNNTFFILDMLFI